MNSDKWCRHFNGIQNPECKAGVKYADVRIETERPYSLPCHGEQEVCSCVKYEPHTPEELAAFEEQFSLAMRLLNAFAERETDICPHCGKQVTTMKQVGRSVYMSCGCRLWQGKIPAAWRAS